MSLTIEHTNYISIPPPPIEEFLPENDVTNDFRLPLNQVKPGSSEVLEGYLQASLYGEKDDWKSAAKTYEDVIRLLPEDNIVLAKTYYLIAVCYYELGEHEKTLKNLKKAAKLWPNNYTIHLDLGREYLLSGKNTLAIQTFRESNKINREGSEAYFYLGYLYAERHQWELAIKHYKDAINSNHRFEQAYIHLAHLYFDLGQKNFAKREKYFLEAINLYVDLLQIKPNQSGVHNNIGVLYSFLGRSEEALQAYQKAIDLEPSNELAEKNLFSLKNALVKERLLKKGSLNRIPDPITDFTPYKKRKLFQIKGKPLSQTIIEERR